MSVTKEQKESDRQFNVTRREFGKAVLGGVLVASPASAGAISAPLIPIPPGMKLSYQVTSWQAGVSSNKPTEEAVAYLKDIGITWLNLWPERADVSTAEGTAERFTEIREKWEAVGFRVYNIGGGYGPSGGLHNMPEVTLNLPGRDQKIAEYLNYLRYLGKARIPYTTYAHMGNDIWRSGQPTVRGDARASEFDMASPKKRPFGGHDLDWNAPGAGPLSSGRVYSEEELWENYTYFIKKVAPVAEEAGVRIGIHPDDPPVPMLAGVPRLFINFQNYVRALEIAASPNIGLCLCCGNMLAAGKQWGKDFVETAHYFGKQRKIFKIHVQALTAPLPHFVETVVDDSYYDYYKIIKALREVDYDGAVMPAHIPRSPANPRVMEAYTHGYMHALIKRANEEVG
jgi:mannonate dehydratase